MSKLNVASFRIAVITAALLASGQLMGSVAFAQTPVPQTGSSQGVNPPNSLPGGSAAFGSSSTASPTPTSAPAPSGAAQGVVTTPSGQNTGAVSTTPAKP